MKTITPDKNGYVPPGTCGSLYNYYPSFICAMIFSLVFGILTIAHIVQASMLKSVCFQLMLWTNELIVSQSEIFMGGDNGRDLGNVVLRIPNSFG